MQRGDSGVMDDHTVTGRVVAVLDVVGAGQGLVTLAELVRGTGVPKSTVRRIAADLVERGMLERVGDRYRLGGHLFDLGVRAATQRGLARAVTPHVQELLARSGEIVWVGMCVQDGLTEASIAYGPNRASDVSRRPWPFSVDTPGFAATAMGRLVLAERPDLVEQLRAHPLPSMTQYTTTSWPRMMAVLGEVRDTGIAYEFEQGALGYHCVATGLRAPDGSLAGVVGVTGRTGGGRAGERVVRPLLAAASEIGRALATTGTGGPGTLPRATQWHAGIPGATGPT